MIVFAAKVSVKKVVAGVLVVGAVALGVAVLAPAAAETVSASAAQGEVELDSKLKTNEQRVALLESYGWQVDPEPRSEREVQIPKHLTKHIRHIMRYSWSRAWIWCRTRANAPRCIPMN